jgi:hypothetical protein
MADRRIGARGPAPAIAVAVVCALGCAASIVADWPGHFPPDALSQLAQGRAGVFNSWHPPVMAWLLGVADRLMAGAPLFIVLQAGLFFAALASLALARRPGSSVVVVIALLAASPLVLVYQGLVVKDVLFADAALAGFAAVAQAAARWERPAVRLALTGLALVLFCLAALARQNGVIVALSGVLALAGLAVAKAGRGRAARAFALTAVSVAAVMAVVCAGAILAFSAHGDGKPEGARQWTALALYDLAGMIRRDPAQPVPLIHHRDPALEVFLRTKAAPAYTPTRIDTLAPLPAWNAAMGATNGVATGQWIHLIETAPTRYLRVRAEVFRQLVAPPHINACAPVLVGVDGDIPRLLRAAGMSARETDKDDWDGDYATAFLHTPVFSHLAYALLAMTLLAWAALDVRRGRLEMIATIGLTASALTFAASFFVIGIACDYRYLYFLDAAAMAALVQRASYWP